MAAIFQNGHQWQQFSYQFSYQGWIFNDIEDLNNLSTIETVRVIEHANRGGGNTAQLYPQFHCMGFCHLQANQKNMSFTQIQYLPFQILTLAHEYFHFLHYTSTPLHFEGKYSTFTPPHLFDNLSYQLLGRWQMSQYLTSGHWVGSFIQLCWGSEKGHSQRPTKSSFWMYFSLSLGHSVGK